MGFSDLLSESPSAMKEYKNEVLKNECVAAESARRRQCWW